MDTQLCFFILYVTLLLLILIYKTNTTRNLPPGPSKLPIIGNLHQFVGSLPHHLFRDLARKYGPIMYLQLGQISTVVISSPELAKEVMKTHDLAFASRPALLAARIIAYNARDIVFSPYGEYWRQLRKICTMELLSTKRIQSFRPIMEEEVFYLIESLKSITSGASVPVNLSKMVLAMSYCIISRSAFGKALDQKDAFTPVVEKAMTVFDGFSISDLFPSISIIDVISGMRSKLQKLHQEIDKIIDDIVKEHRERKKSQNTEANDLVDVLLNYQDSCKVDAPLSVQGIKAVLVDIFLAGVETSATTIDWTMSEMVKNPEVIKKAQAEVRRVYNGKDKIDHTGLQQLTYMNSVIKETLRLHPPAPLLLPKQAREDVEICGYNIKDKTRIIVNAWAIGRDPNYWTEPEKFYPERFLDSSIDYRGGHFKYIPFGSGRRICPGMQYGISVVELTLANLLYHFDWMVPNGKPENLDMFESLGLTARRKNDLYLIPTLQDT